ncbi:ZP3 protein, partial [Pardalotus punctatus]|nr:ZP3 protein [Pardalotus punctatus]
RKSNVSSGTVHPTWAMFHSTLMAQEQLQFSLPSWMVDAALAPQRLSNTFQLRDSLRCQADITSEGHVPMCPFVNFCVAALTGTCPPPFYAFIDLGGCLMDSRAEDTGSAFVALQPWPELLGFWVGTFKFMGDTGHVLYISCHLWVSPVATALNPGNKACSFGSASGLWAPLEGTRNICSCCDTGSYPSPG